MVGIYNNLKTKEKTAVDAWRKFSDYKNSLNGNVGPEIKEFIEYVSTEFERVFSR